MACKCTRKEWYLAEFSVGGKLSGVIVVLEVAAIDRYLRRRRLPRESSGFAL